MKIKPRPCPFREILLVCWHDAQSSTHGDWATYSDLKIEPAINYSVGFHLEDKSTDEILALCLNTTTDPPIDVGEVMQIPREMILDTKRLYPRKRVTPSSPG